MRQDENPGWPKISDSLGRYTPHEVSADHHCIPIEFQYRVARLISHPAAFLRGRLVAHGSRPLIMLVMIRSRIACPSIGISRHRSERASHSSTQYRQRLRSVSTASRIALTAPVKSAAPSLPHV